MKTLIKSLIVIPFLAIAASASAQFSFSGGITGGVSTGNVSLTKMTNTYTGMVEGKNIRGYEAGIFTKFAWDPFYLRPTILYSTRAGQVSYSGERNPEPRTTDVRIDKIEIPVYIGARILGPLSIEAAPVYNYVFDITQNFGGMEMPSCRQGMGIRAGVCLDFKRLFLNANWQTTTFTCKDADNAALVEKNKFNVGLGIALF